MGNENTLEIWEIMATRLISSRSCSLGMAGSGGLEFAAAGLLAGLGLRAGLPTTL